MGEVPRDSSSSTPNSTTISHEKEVDVESSHSVCVCSSLSASLSLHWPCSFYSTFLFFCSLNWSVWAEPGLHLLASLSPFSLGELSSWLLAGRSETHLYQIKPFACVGEWLLRCDTLQCFCNFLVCINYSELQFPNYQITWNKNDLEDCEWCVLMERKLQVMLLKKMLKII